MLENTKPNYENAIAVIGMSCRFPKAKTPQQYWRILHDGIECVSQITEDDLLAAGLNPEIMRHPNYVNRQVVLDDIENFDASFFGYFPRDAEILDPQQRLMLECAWEALESAGYIPGKCKQVIGFYAGADMSQYLFNLYANREIMESVGTFQINLANDKDHVTTRVAYKLNLSGPAVTVQTTCSTSLVAICQASQSLLNYQCDIALAGGTAISLPQKVGYVYQEGGIASPDGYCRAFDARAQGTIGGSGTGVVVLKRMEEALEDGDQIHAVIKGFAINNDGALKVGYTAPSVEGQSEAIAMAQAMAEVAPETITYIEAHGTATPLGDPIEVRALTEVFRASTSKNSYCAIGSVKTNFGHLNSAAGVAGFMKVVLSLKNKQIPPSLHFETPNPNIDFANSPFYVINQLKDWEVNGIPRRAGVSSFGIGGTNAHVILEEPPEPAASTSSRDWLLLPFSTKTERALDKLINKFGKFFQDQPLVNLADVAYTLQVGRKDLPHRKIALVHKQENDRPAKKLLETELDYQNTSSDEEERKVVFMFSGQGSQYVNMAKELYRKEVFFREQVDHCCQLLKRYTETDFLSLIFPTEDNEKTAEEVLTQTQYTQPALFIIEYALAQLWISWGIQPTAMVGHSIGEYVAACISGVFSLDDALKIVAERGKLMQQVDPGKMLSVALPESAITPKLSAELSIGVINTPDLTVVSGPEKAIVAFKKKMETEGHACQLLKTSHAFHSKMFDPIIARFSQIIEKYDRLPPTIPFVSNKSGTWIQAEEATNPNYWAMHLRQTVRFADNINTLSETPNVLFLEVGPGTTLQKLAQYIKTGDTPNLAFSSLPHPKDPTPGDKHLLHNLGRLWLNGVKIDWEGFYANEQRQRKALPTYPFEPSKYWIHPSTPAGAPNGNQKLEMDRWFYLPKWESTSSGVDFSETAPEATGQHHWLIFMDKQGYGEAFYSHFADKPGHRTTVIYPGKGFSRSQPNEYTVNPEVKADFSLLLEALKINDQIPDIILHFWNIDYLGQPLGKTIDTVRSFGFFSLLYFVQHLSAVQPNRKYALYLFTKELYRITNEDHLHPGQALSVGAGKVINQEHQNITFQNIDLNGSLAEGNTLEQIIKEISTGPHAPKKDQITAWRNGQRWKLHYQQAPVKEINQLKLRLRPGGVYLITGGLGGIGTIIAKYLAIRKRATLFLLSRTEMPPRAEWPKYLEENDPSDSMARKIQRINDMESFGAKVFPVCGNVTDKKAMSKLARRINAAVGNLHGIVHSAGVAGGGIISLKTEKEALKVMAPKVDGTLVLQEVFGGKDLDFFILCSSLSAILGGFGQVDYCASNAFQDAFAQQHANDQTYYLSVNWDTWGETGMAVNTEVPDDMKQWQEEGLQRGIKNLEGMQLMEHLIASNQPQVATSTTLLSQRMLGNGHEPANTPPAESREVTVEKKSTAKHKRPDMTVPYVEAGTPVEEKIIFIWQELLGIAPIGIDDNFLELGGHSLLAVQLISRLRDSFGAEISIQDFFEAPTVRALAAYFSSFSDTVVSPEAPKDPEPTTEHPGINTISRVSRESYRVTIGKKGIEEIPRAIRDKENND